MQRYIIRRLLITIPVVIGVTILVYAMLHFSPGDPLRSQLGPQVVSEMDQADIAEWEARLGLDRSFPVQYYHWFRRAIRGDLGISYNYNIPVNQLIIQRLKISLRITIPAFILSALFGISFGIYTAIKQYSVSDYIVTFFGFAGISVPQFFLGLILIYVFGLKLGILPASGYREVGSPETLLSIIRYSILPVITIAYLLTTAVMRYTRSGMLDILQKDFIRTARSKGLAERTIIYKHALRNAIKPVITILGMRITFLISGSVIVEEVFSWPGFGVLGLRSVNARDYAVLVAWNLIIAFAVILANLLIDFSYVLIDPRIAYD